MRIIVLKIYPSERYKGQLRSSKGRTPQPPENPQRPPPAQAGEVKYCEQWWPEGEEVKRNAMRVPGVAAVLSAIIPGLGQFYNGRFLAGILWLIITPGLWIGTGGLLGWVCHLVSAYTAYKYARDYPGQPWKGNY